MPAPKTVTVARVTDTSTVRPMGETEGEVAAGAAMTRFPHGVDVGCLSQGGTIMVGAAVGATHFPHGISVPYWSLSGVIQAGGTAGATSFPHGIDTPILTVE